MIRYYENKPRPWDIGINASGNRASNDITSPMGFILW